MMLPDAAAFDLAIAKGVVVLIILGMLLYLVRLTIKAYNYRLRESNGWSTSRPGVGREKDGSSSAGNSISTDF